MGGGIGQDDGATGAEIYGCIIYNNGWTGSDRPHGDGMYCQNSDTVNQVLVQNNIVWGNYEMGGQVYGSIAIVNYKIDSNISMYNGGFEWTLGGGDTSKQFIFTHNFCAKQSPWWNTTVFLGFNNNQNLDIDFGYNTILGYTEVNVWTQANIHNNNFLGTDMVMRYYKPASGDVSTMDYNYYEYQIPDGGYNPFEQMDSTGAQVGVYATLADWQTAMGFDLHSTENARPVAYSMARSAVYPNAYDSTRAHVVAVNAAGAASAAVDVSSFLTAGDIYHIYSAFNPLGAALATGTYGGGTLNFPLASQPMVQPIGDPSHWTAPDNTFGAYILIKG